MAGTMDRRQFLRTLGVSLAGLAVLPSGLLVPEDAAEPIKRFWPGWRAGQPAVSAPYDFDPATARPIMLSAGDTLRITLTSSFGGQVQDDLAFKAAAWVDVAQHRDGGGYTLLANGLPVLRSERDGMTVYRVDFADLCDVRRG